jgi:hypothetical protein
MRRAIAAWVVEDRFGGFSRPSFAGSGEGWCINALRRWQSGLSMKPRIEHRANERNIRHV